MDKIGVDGVRAELVENGYSEETADKYLELMGQVTNDADGVRRMGEILSGVLEDGAAENLAEIMDTVMSVSGGGFGLKFDPTLVRGMGYYTGTIFEVAMEGFGGSVAGGGRYDNLVEEIGGKPTGAVGFGLGIERLIMILEKQHGAITETPERDVYIGSMGEKGLLKAQSLTYELRKAGIQADCDTVERSVKAQMKYANKIGAKYSVILGDSELESGRVELKDMANSEKSEVALADLPAILKEKCGK